MEHPPKGRNYRWQQVSWILLRHLIGLCLLCCTSGIASGQALSSVGLPSLYYSLNEGLSERPINTILQGRDGFVWLGTPNGLNRFDGYEFLVFNDLPGVNGVLSEHNIVQLLQDKYGNLVIGYRNNISFFDLFNPITHTARKVNLLPDNGIKGRMRQVITNVAGDILVLTTDNEALYLYCYEHKSGNFVKILNLQDSKLAKMPSLHILPLQNGNYLLHDSINGLQLLNNSGSLIHQFKASDFITTNAQGRITYPAELHYQYQDRSGRIWVSLQQNQGVFLLDIDQLKFKPFEALPNRLYYEKIWEDLEGNVLLSQTTGSGLYPEALSLFCVKPDNSTADLSSLLDLNKRVVSVYSEDFFKTIFFGVDSGLRVIQNARYQIKTYLAKWLGREQWGNIMRGITHYDGLIYLLDEAGTLYHLNPATHEINTLRPCDRQTGEVVQLDCTKNMVTDDAGYIWFVSCYQQREGRLHAYDPRTNLMDTYASSYRFDAFTPSRDGSGYWIVGAGISAGGFLIYFSTAQQTFKVYENADGSNPLQYATPYYVFEGSDQTVWIGTDKGIYEIDPAKKTTKSIQASQDNALRSNTIFVIHEDAEGHIWMGTENGLSVLDPKTRKIKTYTRNEGLASNIVCGIVPDERQNLWVSTFYGLSYFDLENHRFHNFFSSDGLSHDEFNRFSFHRDDSGHYYFGGVNGLNVFRREDLLLSRSIPSPLITKIIRYNRKKGELLTSYNVFSELRISPYDIYFQIHFSLPRYSNPTRNQFKTKLEGYEKEWNYIGNTNQIRYNSLPPGRYTLHIEAADPNGNWSDEPLRIPIVVDRIYYKTWWFLMLVSLVLATAAYLLLRYRWEQRLKVERFRTKLSSNLHDELSGLFSGIALQTDMLQTMTTDRNMHSKLQWIGEVSRKAMSSLNDVIWSIDSRKDQMDNLISRMHEHADNILFPLGIKYTIQIQNIDTHRRIPPTVRQELYLIFKESVNNIAKHSNATQVHIYLQNNDGIFKMEIKDNGQGVAKSQNGGSGQGLSNIKMRAQRIDAKVEINKDKGYTVNLRMKKFA
jgi:streptogramin lyase